MFHIYCDEENKPPLGLSITLVAITQGIATLGQAWVNASKQYWANMRLPGQQFDLSLCIVVYALYP